MSPSPIALILRLAGAKGERKRRHQAEERGHSFRIRPKRGRMATFDRLTKGLFRLPPNWNQRGRRDVQGALMPDRDLGSDESEAGPT